MNTQQIQYILKVYQTKSISKAASELYISQPALSNGIRALEHELGFDIFKRAKSGVVPTENGVKVLKKARQMWDSYQEIQHINSDIDSKRIHVGGVMLAPAYRAFERLCLLCQEASDIELSYKDAVSLDPDSFVLSDFDIQVGLLLPRETDSFIKKAKDKEVLVSVLCDVPIVLRIGPQHPLYNKSDISPSDFSSYPMVDYTGKIYRDYPELNHVIPLSHRKIVEVGDKTTKHILVSKGTFFSLGCKLPEDINKLYGFKSIPLSDMRYTLILMERERQLRSPTVQKYIELLNDEISKI